MMESYKQWLYRLRDKAMPCFDWSWPFTASARRVAPLRGVKLQSFHRLATVASLSRCRAHSSMFTGGGNLGFPGSSWILFKGPDGVAPPFGLYLASVGWWECEVVRITLSHCVCSHLKGLGAFLGLIFFPSPERSLAC